MAAKTKLVPIGNSLGVRIPRPLLDESGLSGDVTLSASAGRIVIEAARRPREGWADSMREMAEAGDDAPLLGDFGNEFDRGEWEW